MPFRVVYGRDPLTTKSYEPGDTCMAAVTRSMEEHDEFLVDVHCRLEQAQKVQKKHYEKLHRHVVYQVGDWALLWRGRLHPSPMPSLGSSSRVTLAHTVLSSSSTTSLSYRLYHLMPDCMMCFTSDSSRSFVGHHQMLLHRCPPSTMVHQFDNQIGSCGPGWRARYARSSSSGRVTAARLHGKMSSSSPLSTRLLAQGRAAARQGERCHVWSHV